MLPLRDKIGINSLVVGYGSIGARHARILSGFGHSVAVVSRRPDIYPKCYEDLKTAIADFQPEYIVIANESSQHVSALNEVIGADYRGLLLVEKPLRTLDESLTFDALALQEQRIFIGYNLRFSPALRKLRTLVAERSIFSVQIHCGSYLPHWRPDQDYRKTSSAIRSSGGGVLYDLSHEIDYANWLFGRWTKIAAKIESSGSLEIETEDCVSILATSDRCSSISVTLNYLDRPASRTIRVTTDVGTYFLDMLAGELTDPSGGIMRFEVERDDTYVSMHESVLSNAGVCCNVSEAEHVMAIIDGVRRADSEVNWISI